MPPGCCASQFCTVETSTECTVSRMAMASHREVIASLTQNVAEIAMHRFGSLHGRVEPSDTIVAGLLSGTLAWGCKKLVPPSCAIAAAKNDNQLTQDRNPIQNVLAA